MKKGSNEHLSTLIDGEHGNNKDILEKLISDESMKNTWERYHLIGDCLRANLPEKVYNNFSKDLNNILHNEPTILPPKKVKQFKRKQIIGFAIAASVATLAILSIQQRNNIYPEITTETVVIDEKIIDSQFDTFSFPETHISLAAAEEETEFDLLAKQRLNNYLINHSEYRHNVRLNSVLPYARIVTIESRE